MKFNDVKLGHTYHIGDPDAVHAHPYLNTIEPNEDVVALVKDSHDQSILISTLDNVHGVDVEYKPAMLWVHAAALVNPTMLRDWVNENLAQHGAETKPADAE